MASKAKGVRSFEGIPTTGMATAKQLAEFLQVTELRLAKDRHSGVGPPFIKYGRAVRYRWSAVAAYLADHEQLAG